MSPAKFPRVCPMQAPIVIALSWRWGSIDRSGNKEAQQQRRQRGLGEGNGWEKPVHREEGKQKKKKSESKKINGQDWDDIISPLLYHQPRAADLSLG